MPRPIFRIKVIKQLPKKGMTYAIHKAIFEAYGKLNEKAYYAIVGQAPESKTPSAEFPKGYLRRSFKLVIRKTDRGVPYSLLVLPGMNTPGTPGYKAYKIIEVLHYGWKTVGFTRRPKTKQALAWPVRQGAPVMRPGQSKVIVSKAVQETQITLNPWIARIMDTLEPPFREFLQEQIKKIKTEKKVEKY